MFHQAPQMSLFLFIDYHAITKKTYMQELPIPRNQDLKNNPITAYFGKIIYGSVLNQTFRHKLGHQEKSLRGRWKMLVGVDYRGQLEKAQESCLPMS